MEKMNFPDSDESARLKHPDAAEDNVPDADKSIAGLANLEQIWKAFQRRETGGIAPGVRDRPRRCSR